MDWLEIAVHTSPEGMEPVAEIFQEMSTGGVVIEDPAVILRYAAETHPDEWAVDPVVEGEVMLLVKGYLPVECGTADKVKRLKTALGRLGLDPPPEISARIVAEEDWANAWKAYYRPVHVGRLVIKPSWEEYSSQDGELVIEMDPGMAFGSGTHATTVLCLKLLEKYVRQGITVYDAGTGSGILAIAAAKLDAGRVVAVDLDPVACRVAVDNVERNGLTGKVRVAQGNLLDKVEGQADLIVSNIIASVVTDFAPYAAGALTPGGLFIASGIIRERAGQVCTAMEAAGFMICECQEEADWVALVGRIET